jgi:uncharacterized tellurite resistance protein B-like protein
LSLAEPPASPAVFLFPGLVRAGRAEVPFGRQCRLPLDLRAAIPAKRKAVFETLRRFLGEAVRQQTSLPAGEEELRLASAALLFHVIAVDGEVTDDERAALTAILEQRFGIDDAAAAELMSAAENADDEAVDLYSFTHVLKAALEPEDRERIIEMMWKLVYADGTVHEFEDNAVWRVAELLGVSSDDRIRLKQKVRDHAGN